MLRSWGVRAGSMAVVVAVLGVLGGCSDHDPLALSPAQPVITKPTVPLGEPGSLPDNSIDPATPGVTILASDGQSVDGSQVATVAAALSAASGQDLVLGAEFNRRFLAIQVQAIGFSADATGCVVRAGETAAGAEFATLTVTQLGDVMSQAGPSIAGCVGGGGLPSDLGSPDFSKVPVADLRAVLGELSTATFVAAGLSPEEAACVSGRHFATYDDAELGQLFTSAGISSPLSEDVTACLTGARIVAVAGA